MPTTAPCSRPVRLRSLTVALCLLAVTAASAIAQGARPASVTREDYDRAARMLPAAVSPLVLHTASRPTWLADGRAWYRTRTASGEEQRLVDPSTGRTSLCTPGVCVEGADDAMEGRGRFGATSPDGSRSVFIRDWNLWVRETASGREFALTTDGIPDFGYATDNAGWTHSDRPIVLWSPDGAKIATFRQDQRFVGDMHLVDTRVGHPVLRSWKYPLPGDPVIPMVHRVVIDVAARRVTPLRVAPDAHRTLSCDDLVCGGTWGDTQWGADSATLAFVSVSRDHREARVRIADASTGAVRELFSEGSATRLQGGPQETNWRYLSASHEVLWYAERDDWGHLYLYNADTGALTRRVTTGAGNIARVLRIDASTREAYVVGMGFEAGRDPYFRFLYRVGLDTGTRTLLTPEDATHEVSIAPDLRHFIDSYSTPDTPPTTVLRTTAGDQVAVLETADISRLLATGWRPPRRITVKARDGVTDLYGLLYLPSQFRDTLRYPLVDVVYPGPQAGSVGTRSFVAGRGDRQALAELGFVVVEVDGMGTPYRSRTFQDRGYGDLSDNGIADQVAAVRELARRFPWIDLSHGAGIWGHSGGGYATATAMLRAPDTFSVGVAEAGNHDNRTYEDDWGEQWMGLLTSRVEGGDSYDAQAVWRDADKLRGHLLLAYGTMDDNVPPNNTLLLVDALIKANKDFDLLALPNRNHGFGNDPYMMRRRWDYFVRYLRGTEPPPPVAPQGPATPPTRPTP